MKVLRPYDLIEPCCGSAAFSLSLLGARRAILPYQGSKWKFRHCLQKLATSLGFVGKPRRIVLNDPGPWGRALGVVLDPQRRAKLIGRLKHLNGDDPASVYKRLHKGQIPQDNPVEFAAEFLFLQRLAFSGKAVGARGGHWASPGFNKTSAYGVAATDRFGEVRPMIPSLIRVLEDFERYLDPTVEICTTSEYAKKPRQKNNFRTLVYLDPPYEGSTSYPDGQMCRREVESLAKAWLNMGATVMISEQRGLALKGWGRQKVYGGRKDTSPFRGKQEEWVTFATPEDTHLKHLHEKSARP